MIKVVNGFKNALLVLIIVVAGHVLLAPLPPPGGSGGAGGGCVGKSWLDPFYCDDVPSPGRQSFGSLQERQVASQRSAMIRQQETQRRQMQQQQMQQ